MPHGKIRRRRKLCRRSQGLFENREITGFFAGGKRLQDKTQEAAVIFAFKHPAYKMRRRLRRLLL